jgi:hypothetical protein
MFTYPEAPAGSEGSAEIVRPRITTGRTATSAGNKTA